MEQFRTSSGNDASSCTTWMSSRRGGEERESAVVQLWLSCGSAWCGPIVYGSVWIMVWFSLVWFVVEWFSSGSALVQLWVALCYMVQHRCD